MPEKKLTCINCPLGCNITVKMNGSEIVSIEGNTCKRGEEYARSEIMAPKRTITGLVSVEGRREPLSVRTSQPIPKELILECAGLLRKTVVSGKFRVGDVVIKNVLGTGSDIIATKNMQ